jgi:hypothetical protein
MVLIALLLWGAVASGDVAVFEREPIRFDQGTDDVGDGPGVRVLDNGRAVERSLNLPEHEGPVRVLAHLIIEPIPKDEQSVCDKWDRAGNVSLKQPNAPDIELIKFVTAYGGRTEYDFEVTELLPVLAGPITISAFIDTWVNPAWLVSFSLRFEPDSTLVTPTWVHSVLNEQGYKQKSPGEKGIEYVVKLPPGLRRVELQYLVSGHCTDGRGADEFEPKDNVIRVDDRVVYRCRPWRDDCRQFREINPYCRRWSDGYWSSDYDRSGWCPGDLVTPLTLDLTDHLAAGNHTLRFVIEDVRPEGEEGHHGYWRISARLIGWTDLPATP